MIFSFVLVTLLVLGAAEEPKERHHNSEIGFEKKGACQQTRNVKRLELGKLMGTWYYIQGSQRHEDEPRFSCVLCDLEQSGVDEFEIYEIGTQSE